MGSAEAGEIPYLRTFSNDLSPARLRHAAALNGFPAPLPASFRYLEVGFGNGDTLATLAAAYPQATFVGIDINPTHVAFANRLAADSGLTNVRFVEADVETFGAGEPAFDFVTMFGFLSWISPETRFKAIALASTHLRVGGLLFASYNALPGWAPLAPLRRLLHDVAQNAPGSSYERAEQALAVARILDEGGAHYFETTPAARQMLADANVSGLPYVIHEYLMPEWHPMYFEDLAREMALGGLHFVGQFPLFLNYRDLAIPGGLLEQFKSVTDRVAFETLKDFAVNEGFRRDVFMKGAIPHNARGANAYLDTTRFGTVLRADEIDREVRFSHRTLRFVGPIYDALIPAIATAPASAIEAAARPDLAAFGLDKVRDALLHLVIGGQVVSFVAEAPSLEKMAPDRVTVPSPHNRAVLARTNGDDDVFVVSAPATGTGIVLTPVEAVCLRALVETTVEERPAFLRRMIRARPMKLEIGADRPIDEQLDVLANEVDVFREARVPKLVQLGVVANR